MADRETGTQHERRGLPLKTPRRLAVGAAFFLAAASVSTVEAADPVCGPRLTSVEIPAALHRFNDIPFLGENVVQVARASIRNRDGPACGRNDLYFREVAFDTPFDELRAEYLLWLETNLTGPAPLTSAYVRNHGVEIVDEPGQFRFIDRVKSEPDRQGRLEIHLTEEIGAKGRACRQVVLRYTYLGAVCEATRRSPG